MITKHKNYEWIVAFAEGKTVECKSNTLDGAFDDWEEVKSLYAFDESRTHLMYRIKPEEPQKSVGYKLYVWMKDGIELEVRVFQEYDVSTPYGSRNFVRWIHSEWQYEPVESPVVNVIKQGIRIPVGTGVIPPFSKDGTPVRYGIWYNGGVDKRSGKSEPAGWCMEGDNTPYTHTNKCEAIVECASWIEDLGDNYDVVEYVCEGRVDE